MVTLGDIEIAVAGRAIAVIEWEEGLDIELECHMLILLKDEDRLIPLLEKVGRNALNGVRLLAKYGTATNHNCDAERLGIFLKILKRGKAGQTTMLEILEMIRHETISIPALKTYVESEHRPRLRNLAIRNLSEMNAE